MGGSSGHILVVDDNRMNRIKLTRILEQEGHTVTAAEDGEQALALMQARSFDGILLDIVMPGLDGYQVLARIKSDPLLRDLPVIVISAVDEMESVVRCIEQGAEDYLPKPFNTVLLRARLTACLEKKKLRDLERAYLEQEMMLRQAERLATLGKLSAGMAHELNNPAAATLRGAGQLRETLTALQRACLTLQRAPFDDAQLNALEGIDRLAAKRAVAPVVLDPIAIHDREEQLEAWCEKQDVKIGWQVAPALVALGYDEQSLDDLARLFPADLLPALLTWSAASYTIYSLLEEISQGAGRVAAIVGALKAYSYLDQAPLQTVDVHQGLDSTLLMLSSRLENGITVEKRYAQSLPRIEAYGSELNQVWTHIIDNALVAMGERGRLSIRTRPAEEGIIVEIEDDGVGIAPEIQPKIFDPFVTTRPPGQGAGLGLSICHAIVVHKHKGKISATSGDGRTIFQIWLPLACASA